MGKPTKEEAGYRLPDKSCATCKHSYFGTYDNTMCILLKPEQAEIDCGGVCNLWEAET